MRTQLVMCAGHGGTRRRAHACGMRVTLAVVRVYFSFTTSADGGWKAAGHITRSSWFFYVFLFVFLVILSRQTYIYICTYLLFVMSMHHRFVYLEWTIHRFYKSYIIHVYISRYAVNTFYHFRTYIIHTAFVKFYSDKQKKQKYPYSKLNIHSFLLFRSKSDFGVCVCVSYWYDVPSSSLLFHNDTINSQCHRFFGSILFVSVPFGGCYVRVWPPKNKTK